MSFLGPGGKDDVKGEPVAKRMPGVKRKSKSPEYDVDDVAPMNSSVLEEGLSQYLVRTQGALVEESSERRRDVYNRLRTNTIYRASNRQGAARARLESINDSFQVREPAESRRFESLAVEARLWLLLRELGVRELRQFEAATSFRPSGRETQKESEVAALLKWVREEAIQAITKQEDLRRGGGQQQQQQQQGPGNAQYLREMCAAKAPFVMNNFYDHIGGINMRGRAQATGGFTTEELTRNNALQLVYEEDGAAYKIDPDVFPQAAQTLFSTLRETG